MAELSAEQKLSSLKLKLSEEIRHNDRQIKYEIKKGAKAATKLIRDKFTNGCPDTLELSKQEYTAILDYLYCVEEDVMYKYKGSEFSACYYDDNRIKTDIINQI